MHNKRRFRISRERVAPLLRPVFGMVLLWASEFLRSLITRDIQSGVWWRVIFLVVLYMILLCMSMSLFLVPFRKFRFVSAIVKILAYPIGIGEAILHIIRFFTAPFLIFILLLSLLLGMWGVTQAVGITPEIDLKGFLYPVLVIMFLVFTILGNKIVAGWFRVLGGKKQIDIFLPLLTPRLMRLYLYVMTALVYFIAKEEQFADVQILPFYYWVTYKDVFSEVLVTFVAIDAIAGAWRDRHKGTG